MSASSLPAALPAFRLLEERERSFRITPSLAAPLERVRRILRDELSEEPVESLTLARAGLVLASAGEGESPAPEGEFPAPEGEFPAPEGERMEDRLIPLAAGVEMIYHALTVQQSALHPGEAADLFGILSQDLVLSRALDLYTRDGDPRVMDAVSRGAAHLCEALMADHAGEPLAVSLGCLCRFHEECARIGAAASGQGEAKERERAQQVREAFQLSLEARKENSPFLANRHEKHPRPLEEFLRRWPSAPPETMLE
ncbi:MAG: hypothetical protein KY468_15415 [Armatimonadetes bacterium]|nr:hypothetical protein [Armatimonadota bacterium]